MIQEAAVLGNVIRGIRRARNLSQETLAHESGVNRAFLSQIERGIQQPTVETLFKLARALETSTVTIFGLVEERLVQEVRDEDVTEGVVAEPRVGPPSPDQSDATDSLATAFLDDLEQELCLFWEGGDKDGALLYAKMKARQSFLMGLERSLRERVKKT